MLRETPNTEAVIIEYGFLDNAKDAAKLKANYKDYAEAVVRAVMDYKNLPYTPPKDSGAKYYTVKSGDTLWTIAKNNGLTVDELKQLNNLTNNSLSIGQTLKVSQNETITPEPIQPDQAIYYTVKSGDNLYAIANKFGTTVNKIKELNNLSSNLLSIGQQLLIKEKDSLPDTDNTVKYTIKSGDTLYSIARKYGTTVDAIKNANNLSSNTLTIGKIIIIPNNNNVEKTYIVQKGDSLYGIARKYGTTVDKLKDINNLQTNILSIGQKLLLP